MKEINLKDLIEFAYWLNHKENNLININGLTIIEYMVSKDCYKRMYIDYLRLKEITEYNEEDLDYNLPLEIEIKGITFKINFKETD